jgi:biotin synthase
MAKNLLVEAHEACSFREVAKTRGVRITNLCNRVPICYYCNYMTEPVYKMTVEEAIERVTELQKEGVNRITLVSGWISYQNTMAVPFVKALRREFPDLIINAAAGPISKSSLKALKEVGLDQYGCNLEAPPEILVKIKGNNDIPERIQTLRDAREVGLQVSTGFIIGIGESQDQLNQMLQLIRTIDPANVFMTPFEPFPDTPMSGFPAPSLKTTLETIAKTRLRFKDKTVGMRIIRQGNFIPNEFLNLAVFAGVNLVAPPPKIEDMATKTFENRLKNDIQNLEETEQNLLRSNISPQEIADYREIAESLRSKYGC